MIFFYDSIYNLVGIKFNFISLLCALWLSVYFIVSFTIVISRYFTINSWISNENLALENLMLGRNSLMHTKSFLKNYDGDVNKLPIYKNVAMSKSTKGLTFLSVIASTSPFIGLFGTIVSILITFGEFGSLSHVGLNVLAPKISEALVVTAFGILVAIPAYTFHLVIKRKVYDLSVVLDNEMQILSNSLDKYKIE